MPVGETTVLESRRSVGFHGQTPCSMQRVFVVRYARVGQDEQEGRQQLRCSKRMGVTGVPTPVGH